MSDIQCVVVTPERTEVDTQTESVTVPLVDGEMGILKGHSPLVGRLGYGILHIAASDGPQKYFVEGGFVQVVADVVSVLTDRLVPLSDITKENATEAMKSALAMPTDQQDLAVAREKALTRARAMTRVALQ